jgi:hypothetical protein
MVVSFSTGHEFRSIPRSQDASHPVYSPLVRSVGTVGIVLVIVRFTRLANPGDVSHFCNVLHVIQVNCLPTSTDFTLRRHFL